LACHLSASCSISKITSAIPFLTTIIISLVGANMKLRKIVSTILIAAMLFFAPSLIPSMERARAIMIPCGVHPSMLTIDTAFAGGAPIPCPLPPKYVPAWWWAAFACPASIILSGLVANYRDHRQLTTAEAWTCGLLYWIPMPPPPPPVHHHH